jgi:catechol 2,3-dioxygenase
MTFSRAPTLSHFGLYVTDLDRMLAFYTGLFGMRVTDRGQSPVFHNTLVFLSSDPAQHHQLVLATGRPPGASFSTVMQLSFKVRAIEDLRVLHRAAPGLGAQDLRAVNHCNSFSLYFGDPEGNTVEAYFDTEFHVSQPHADPLNLNQSDEALLSETERRAKSDPTYLPVEEWRRRFVAAALDA